MTAELHVLSAGYAHERVASTVVLIQDEGRSIIVDPGMVSDRGKILDPLASLGVDPAEVGDVVFSHHHPDHTLNAALFERARFHDFWAIYQADTWTDREADGFQLSPSVTLMATPGHTAQDITTLVETDGGTRGLHAPVVVRGRPRRGPAGRGPGGARAFPGSAPRARPGADRARSRGAVPPRCGAPGLTSPHEVADHGAAGPVLR